jgi:TonB-linked SusC/RagA family outer membrane protein
VRQRSVLAPAFFVTFLLLAPVLEAQQVTGRVTSQTGEPLAAVQVFITGSGIGALTQQNGRFLLLNVPPGTHALTAERIGYRPVTQQVTVSAGQTVVQDFLLTEQALGLDEIIVTGTPGGTQRRAIGNSVASVSAAEVTQSVAVQSTSELLRGRTPGLTFSSVSGDVGGGSAIKIRGTGSFNLSTNPLVFVDGVRINNTSTAGPNIGGGRQSSVLNDFNPDDIESIEIIKGPAAATLYGTEASAGVIQIITKRGSEGTPQFEASVRQGANFQIDPEGRLGTQWTCKATFAPPCTEEVGGLVPYNMYLDGSRLAQMGAFDWPTENLYSMGHSQSYSLSVRGGTQSIRYFISTGYDDDQGHVWWNTDKVFQLRGNVGVVFSDAFTLDVQTGYVDGKTRYASPVRSDGGIWDDLMWSNGHCLPWNSPGPDGQPLTADDECRRLMGFQEHLPSDVGDVEGTRMFNRFTGGATLNFTPSELISSRAIIGLDKEWNENGVLFPKDAPGNSVYPQTRFGEVGVERPMLTNLSLDLSSTLKLNLFGVGTSTSVGAQYYFKRLNELAITGRVFPTEVSRTVNQTPVGNATVEYNFVENKSLGFYVQEQLSFNDRIFVTGAVRFDDNSAFGSEFELETYPKIAATWTVSEESFWGVDLINSLRVRGAWGKAGRQPDTFAGTNLYGVTTGPAGGSSLIANRPGNPAVGPEVSTELELGFDMSVLEDRISGEFTWFSKQNNAALLSVAPPPSTGVAGSFQRNLGRIDNWGWEATINTRVYEGDFLNLGLMLTGSHVMNEIKDLGDFPGNANVKIGLPYPNWMARYWIVSAEYDVNGKVRDLWNRPNGGSSIRAMCEAGIRLGPTPQHGVKRGGEVIDCENVAADQQLFGPAFPTYTFAVAPTIGLFNNALQLNILAEAQYGRKGKDGQDAGHRYKTSRVSREENNPVWIAGDRYRTSQVWGYFDADFWKLREVGARYNLPEFVTSRIGAERASLSLSARNIAILWRAQDENWGLKLQDPEFGPGTDTGTAWFIEPPLSSVHATLRVTF